MLPTAPLVSGTAPAPGLRASAPSRLRPRARRGAGLAAAALAGAALLGVGPAAPATAQAVHGTDPIREAGASLPSGAPEGAPLPHLDAGPSPAPWPGAEAVTVAARRAVAEAWSVDPARVVLEWGPLPADRTADPPPDARVELLGSGSGGYWVASVDGGPVGSDAAPVRLRLRSGVMALRPHAARPLERDRALEPGDIRWEAALVWGAPTTPAHRVEPGWVTRRVVDAGEILSPPAVDRPDLVRSGDPVDVVYVQGAVSVKVQGRAEGTGALGETVLVRTDTGRRLTARVTGPGAVRVGPGPGDLP